MNHAAKLALAGGLFAAATAAQAEFSANVALSTDYVWRGVSQTNEDPAISGGFDYNHDSGFYAGVWGSNVEFHSDAHIELDLYGGWAHDFGNGFGLDLGVIGYNYPSEDDLNFQELYVGGSYKFVSAKYSYDPDNKNGYLEAAVDFEVGQGVNLGAHVGHYDFDQGDDYTDYKLAVSKELGGFGFELAYTDTDIDNSDIADGRLVLSVSKSM